MNSSNRLTRRSMLRLSASTCMVVSTASNHVIRADDQTTRSVPPDAGRRCSLGFSTYGMKAVTTERAVSVLSEIGFDAIELAVRSGWDADAAMLGAERRQSLRERIADSPLRLTSLMEHVYPTNEKQQAIALERLKLAAGVAHDLAPEAPPLIQTVLGNGDFQNLKSQIRDRLGQWIRIADESETVIAVKPHRGGVVSKPADAVWLFDQLGNPARLRMVYDYSHYAYRDLSLEQTIDQSLPYVAHVAVKDAFQKDGRVVFDLPGATGSINFADLIKRLFEGGYRGDFNCEVSGMVSNQPGYDPIQAAMTCYRNMSAAFERSQVPREA